MLRQDDFLRGQLVLWGWRQGKAHGGHIPSEMMIHVLANRQRLGFGTWLQIIDNAPKYSAIIEQPTGTPEIWSPEFVRLLHSIEGIFDGSAKDPTKGSLYFADLAQPITNEWFKTKILDCRDVHPMVANMNSLSFFK